MLESENIVEDLKINRIRTIKEDGVSVK